MQLFQQQFSSFILAFEIRVVYLALHWCSASGYYLGLLF